MKVDYVTSEDKLKKLLDKYGTVTGYLKKAGFDQISIDGQATFEIPLESTTLSEKHHCGACGKEMTPKQGTSKAGKAWKGWFCENRDHEPQWVK